MGAKEIIFKHAQRAIQDAKHTGMGVHDGNARIQYNHLEWMIKHIEELEQQLQQARREGWEQAKSQVTGEINSIYQFDQILAGTEIKLLERLGYAIASIPGRRRQ